MSLCRVTASPERSQRFVSLSQILARDEATIAANDSESRKKIIGRSKNENQFISENDRNISWIHKSYFKAVAPIQRSRWRIASFLCSDVIRSRSIFAPAWVAFDSTHNSWSVPMDRWCVVSDDLFIKICVKWILIRVQWVFWDSSLFRISRADYLFLSHVAVGYDVRRQNI